MVLRELVIFGLDGVLVEMAALRAEAWAAALAGAGQTWSADRLLARLDGVDDRTALASLQAELGRPLPPTLLNDVRTRLRSANAAELMPVQDALGALRRLRGRVAVVTLTSAPVAREALEKVAMWRHFTSATFPTELVERVPPAPDIYQYAAAQMGVPAARCLVIESTVHGVRAGKAAGMTVFGFVGGASKLDHAQAAKLDAAGADLVFDRMRELAPLVGARAA
ncbi:MAG: HAD family phosphatase [Geminicoccaceae bacterium]|nr:MAG: HAD family phosphatase [Geminicoccaceae bacterium]